MHQKQRMVSVSRAPGFEGSRFVILPGDQRPVLSLPCETASCQSVQCEPRTWRLCRIRSAGRLVMLNPNCCFERQWVCELCCRSFCLCTLVCSALGFLCDSFFFSSAAGVPPKTKRIQAGTRVSQSKICSSPSNKKRR